MIRRLKEIFRPQVQEVSLPTLPNPVIDVSAYQFICESDSALAVQLNQIETKLMASGMTFSWPEKIDRLEVVIHLYHNHVQFLARDQDNGPGYLISHSIPLKFRGSFEIPISLQEQNFQFEDPDMAKSAAKQIIETWQNCLPEVMRSSYKRTSLAQVEVRPS